MSEPIPDPAAGPRHEITYDFTPALGRAVFRAYFWRRYAGVALASVMVFVIALILLGSRDLKLLAAFLLGFDVALWSSWVKSYRAAGKQGEGLSSPTVRITLLDEGWPLNRPTAPRPSDGADSGESSVSGRSGS